MRRPPLVSVSLRKRRFLCLERERRNPAAWTMQQSAVTTPAAAYPLRPIRYGTTSIPSIHHPTDQQRPRDVQKENPPDHHHHHHHPHSNHTENQCKIHQLHQYLPAVFSVRHETYLTYLTLPHLFGSHPKRKTSSLIHPSIHPRGPVPHDIQVSEILLSKSSSYYLTLGS